MNKRKLLTRTVLASSAVAIACSFGQGRAFAALYPAADSKSGDMYHRGQTGCTDYWNFANYANSPLPTGAVTTLTSYRRGERLYRCSSRLHHRFTARAPAVARARQLRRY